MTSDPPAVPTRAINTCSVSNFLKKIVFHLCRQNPRNLSASSGGSRIFHEMGGANPPETPSYDFAKIFQKLHEIGIIWTPEVSLASPLDRPMIMFQYLINFSENMTEKIRFFKWRVLDFGRVVDSGGSNIQF